MDIVETQVEVKTPDGSMPVFISSPKGVTTAPAVLVIHELSGVDEIFKNVARRFSKEGYIAVAPDLYYRWGRDLNLTATVNNAPLLKVYAQMTNDGVVKDLKAVAQHVKSLPNLLEGRIGIVGYCMGGRVAFMAACAIDGIRASAFAYADGIIQEPGMPYWGLPPIQWAPFAHCPMIGFWAGKDVRIPPDVYKEIERTLKQMGKSIETRVYPEADHGFFVEGRRNYQPEPSEQCWRESLEFFHRHLSRA